MKKAEAIKFLETAISEIKKDTSKDVNIIAVILQNDKKFKPILNIQVNDANYTEGENK